MNEEIKAKWIGALRSGEFEQGTGKLAQIDDENGSVRYCCLGVLCEIARKVGVVNRRVDTGAYHYAEKRHVLPYVVKRWASLPTDNPVIGTNRLSDYNDTLRLSFDEIADLIESNL